MHPIAAGYRRVYIVMNKISNPAAFKRKLELNEKAFLSTK
jgi:hypothetical protein